MLIPPFASPFSGLGSPFSGNGRVFSGRSRNTIRPQFELNFAGITPYINPVIGPGTTVVSSSANGTYVNSSGVVTQNTANNPRFDYDPTNIGVIRGLLIEDIRTNLCIRSGDMNDAAWSKTATGVNDGATTGPDGTASGDGITATAVLAGHFISSTAFTITASDRMQVMIFAKAGSETTFDLYLQNVGATRYGGTKFTLTGNGSTSAADIASAGYTVNVGYIEYFAAYGFYLCAMDITTVTDVSVQLVVYPRGANAWTGPGGTTNTIYLWGADAQVKGTVYSFGTAIGRPRSHIPTAGASVLRAADESYILTDPSWYNATEGTIFVEYMPQTSNNAVMTSFENAAAPGSIAVYIAAGTVGALYVESDGGGVQCNMTASSVLFNQVTRTAASYKADDYSITSRGGAVSNDFIGPSLPTVDRLKLGWYQAITNQYLNAHLRVVRYWSPKRTEIAMQQLSIGSVV